MNPFLCFVGRKVFPGRMIGHLTAFQVKSCGLRDRIPPFTPAAIAASALEASGSSSLRHVASLAPTLAMPWIGFSAALLILFLLMLAWLWLRRRQTRAKLQACGLPTIYWRPKVFVNCLPLEEEGKELSGGGGYPPPSQRLHGPLPSSTITNILPRMERLRGPYGMYGTVYGLSTAVIHVAHPIPAMAILSSSSSSTSGTASNKASSSSASRKVSNSAGATKAPAYDHFINFCGNGVFTSDGSDWKHKRSAVMHALFFRHSSGSHSTFESTVEQEAHIASQQLIRRLERLFVSSSIGAIPDDCHNPTTATPSRTVVVNVVPLLQRTTIGLIYKYLTHSDLPDDDNRNNNNAWDRNGTEEPPGRESEPVHTTRSSVPSLTALLPNYQTSITRIRMIILAQSRSIWFVLPRWAYRRCSRLYRAEEQAMQPIRAFSRSACCAAQPQSPLAQLSQALPYQVAPSLSSPSSSPPLSQALLDEAITLLFAGQDTSAATLSWTLHLLSLYPHQQQQLADEVTKALANIPHDQPLNRKTLGKLPYLDAVIKESMRLYPVAPFVVRRLPYNVTIPKSDVHASTVTLPANALACIWIYSLHRHPQFWKSPNAFQPERWLVPASDDESSTSFSSTTYDNARDIGIRNGAYMPFAVGPRNCIGQPLAHIILRSLLARLIQNFEFRDQRLDGTNDPESLRNDMQAGFTVLPQGGVHVRVTKRMVASS